MNIGIALRLFVFPFLLYPLSPCVHKVVFLDRLFTDRLYEHSGLLSCFADIFLGILAAMLQRRYIAVYPVAISFGGMLLLQNFIGLFPDAVFALGIGEHHEWGSLFGRSVSAYLMFALSCILGLVMGWASINAQQYVTGERTLPPLPAFGGCLLKRLCCWQRPR